MAVIKTTLLEVLILGVLAAVIGFGGNAVRAKNAIDFTRNYFDKGLGRLPWTPATEPKTGVAPATFEKVEASVPVEVKPEGAGAENPADEEEKHIEHGYQEVSFEQVAAIFEGRDPATGAYVLVDARNDHLYQDGHIPGAIQCDHYRLNDYLDNVLPTAQQVEKVIIYCNGGDCEDSIFMCGDLIDAGIPYESIYLYTGGWKQWTKKGMPIAKGRDPGSPDLEAPPEERGQNK